MSTTDLVELARAALLRLAEVHPPSQAERLAAELDKAWRRRPWVAGLAGDVGSRTEVVNYLCGTRVLDPAERAAGCAALRIRRGPATRFRALREDGSTEDHALPSEVDGDDASARTRRVETARSELGERELALVRIERGLPWLVRVRPRGWLFWLWPIWWLLARRHHRTLAERGFALRAADEARRQLATTEHEHAEVEARARVVRTRYFESLRALGSGAGVHEVVMSLAGGPLPEAVEVLEMPGAARGGGEVDAVLFAERGELYTTRAADSAPVRIGALAGTVAALPELLAKARALELATGARDAIGGVLATAADVIDRAESGFRARLDRLEDLRIADPQAFVEAELARVKPQVAPSVHAVMEHGSTHLGAELAGLSHDWIGAISRATTNDELKETITRLEASSTTELQRIASEVRLLVLGGVGGCAHDLYQELASGLRSRGLIEERSRSSPALPAIALLPALESPSAPKLGGAVQWLAGLFRSFDSRKTEIREKAHARLEHVREVAFAELMDAEPRLHAMIGELLATRFSQATARQVAWHAGALGSEQAAIKLEREVLAPMVRVRDVTRPDVARLTRELDALADEKVPIAAAAAS